MKRYGMALIALLAGVVLTACGGAPRANWTLEMTGAVDAPQSWSYRDLTGMPQTELTGILMQRTHGEDSVGDWSGVALTALLDQAGADGDWVTITARAADGYAIEISRAELEGAIVALQDGGEWIARITPDHGPIRLVCPLTPADRWVYQLNELHVNLP